MKRKYDEKQDSGSELDPIPVDPEMTTLPAQFKLNPHHRKKHKSGDLLGGHEEDKEKDASQSKLDMLPLELQLAMLTRLPAKTLKSLGCVSKMWSSFIRSPEMVRSFFSISSTRPRLILGVSNGIRNDPKEMLNFFFSFSPQDEEETSFSLPNFEMASKSVNITAHTSYCNSLHGLLIVGYSSELTICNPSTEQFIQLPYGIKHVGYDPIADQYKAFTLTPSIQYDTNGGCLEHKVLTLGGNGGWRHVEPPSMMPYATDSKGISIDGSIYYGAYSPAPPTNPGIVHFDVRTEKLTYIKTPEDIVYRRKARFINYKGKLASILGNPVNRFHTFDLWVLEDVEKQEWSHIKCAFPSSIWNFVEGEQMCFPGTNKAGDIIMAPMRLTRGRPYCIFYYNVETRNIRRVRLRGITENQEFMRSYGFVDKGECHVRIAPQHVESIGFFRNTISFPHN